MSANSNTHVVFIIDLVLNVNFEASTFTQCIDSFLAFGTSFLMQSGQNKLTILGSSTVKNSILYLDNYSNTTNAKINDQQNEQFALVCQLFREFFLKWARQCSSIANKSETSEKNNSLLSGSIAQALCLINANKSDYNNSRIIIFSLGSSHSDNYSSQYLKLINCFFAAQKINVVIDACTITMARNSEESAPVSASMEDRFSASILQQGCDLTGGRYIRVHKIASLLEHLFWCLSPLGKERSQYILPPKLKISPPAACFCHRKVLEIGYVCSVCVSIFCQYLPFCSTCNSNMFKYNLKQITDLKQQSNEEKSV